ncbi:DUF7344 domain-containing protein [Haladaptatus halobius]|uniref:DUF7344 domain-containing protein n=1 Tax=Haladaptatus halobius TaxID=2884875 RepID=UPI001D0A51C1|nr:hypothetical protein [Haladaptatus halobius]
MEGQFEKIPPQDATAEQTNRLFNILADRRRRYILQRLQTANQPISLEELVADISAWEDAPPPETALTDRVDEVTVSLQHCHLPKLADAGLIEYDRSTKNVAHTDHPQVNALVDSFSELFPGEDERGRTTEGHERM